MKNFHIPAYSYYNFSIEKPELDNKGSFCVKYKGIFSFTTNLNEIIDITNKDSLLSLLEKIKTIDLIKFCLNFINFRKQISLLMYKISYEKKTEFFFNFNEFSEYSTIVLEEIVKKINQLIDSILRNDELSEVEHKALYEKEKLPSAPDFNEIENKLIVCMERIYNKQRNYSSDIVINSRIHTVVALYPSFGRHFDKMLKGLELFYEDKDGECLTLNRKKNKEYTNKLLAAYFGYQGEPAYWKQIELLFNVKNLAKSFQQIKKRREQAYIELMKYLESE